MRRGPRWADHLPGISNSLNWLSENTFGAARDLRDGVDALAGWYRAFLDALPYRRQDGRAARALPRGRAASAFEKWEAFKSGRADVADAARDDGAAVGGVAAMLAHERAVEAFWAECASEASRALAEGNKNREAPNRGSGSEKKFVMTEGQTSALVADTMGLALALRRAAAAAAAAPPASAGGVAGRDADPAEVDAAAEEVQDKRAELLSGWVGGGTRWR